MNSLIESINKISQIKADLNSVLEENGSEGGEVFTDYPDKFRELFRLATVMTTNTATGYKADKTYVPTDIPMPELSVYENVVTIVRPLDTVTIKYWFSSLSGDNNRGLTELIQGNTFVAPESGTFYCYAELPGRGKTSETNSIWVEWEEEVVPDPPTIVREGNTVTITPADENDTVYYNIAGEGWAEYTEPITVYPYQDVSSYSKNYRGQSDIVTDEAPEKPVAPDAPVISFYHNVVTITCATEDAEIWYKKITDDLYTRYTGDITITKSAAYVAKSVKNNLPSDESDAVYCEFVPKPETPTVNVSNNKVYITCSTSGVEIYYKVGDGEYQLYTAPITLTETISIKVKSKLDWRESDESASITCTYEEPEDLTPEVPEISCENNVVTITCETEDATIKYRIYESGSEWAVYEGPFEISETAMYEAYATKNDYNSDPCEPVECVYEEPAEPETVADPVFACSNNRVTITCSTLNATIWYRNVNDANWTEYNVEYLTITENTTFVAYASKTDWNDSNQVTYNAEYTDNPAIIPDDPVITCVDNIVTITCDTEGATIYYSIDYGTFIEYTNPFNINSTIMVQAYAIYYGEQSNTVNVECMYVKPNAPIINNILNEITISGWGRIYYKIDDGEYSLYTEPFTITSDCTIYAYVYYHNAYSDITSLECVWESTVFITPWFKATYYRYTFSFSQYSDFTSLSQVTNKRQSVTGQDMIRFVTYNNKLYMQFNDYSFAKKTKNSSVYRLNKESYTTTNDISSAIELQPRDLIGYYPTPAPIQNIKSKLESFTSENVTICKDSITLKTFNKGTHYMGDGPIGTPSITFGMAKQTARTLETITINSLSKYIQYLLSNNNQTNMITNGKTRFGTMNKWNNYTDYPFNYFYYVTGNVNNLVFYEDNKYEYVYSWYEVELSEYF